MVILDEATYVNKSSVDPKREFPEKHFTYIDIDSIENEAGVIKSAKTIRGEKAPSRARRLVKYDDVIMSTVRPYLKAFAVIPKEYDGEICSTGFAVLTCKEIITPPYLLYTLFSKSIIDQCKRMMVGAQYPALNTSQVKNIKIPLPPLPEQKKIAEILSTVNEAIQKVDEAIEKTERLKKGLMKELFTRGIGHKEFKETEIGRIPKEWEVARIGEVGNLQYGYTASALQKKTGVKLLRITDIQDNGQVNWKKVPYCEIENNDYQKYRLFEGDVLFVRIGATTGKTAFVDRRIEGVFASYLIRFKPLSENISTKFFRYYTQSNIYWRQAHKYKEGQLKKGLNAKILSDLKLPLPPLPEQKKIAEIISTVDERIEHLGRKKEKLERVKKGLMQDLLTGRKRVKVEA